MSAPSPSPATSSARPPRQRTKPSSAGWRGWRTTSPSHKHPEGSDQHLFYYLYSLERVGRILDTEFIGTHEWYPLGAPVAAWTNQKADGTWGGGATRSRRSRPRFALMFLTRATSTLNPEQKRGGDGKLRTDVAVAPGHRVYIILDCSGSMLPEMGGQQKFQAVARRWRD